MKFIDTFEKPSAFWVRGATTPGEKTHWPTLSNGEHENHVTLSGRGVNPVCFGEFTASVRFSFPKEDDGYAVFGFGKPFEWSQTAESKLRVIVSRNGAGKLLGQDGSTLAEFAIKPNAAGEFSLSIAKAGDTVTLNIPNDPRTITLPQGTDTAGYFSVEMEKTPVRFCAFEVESPVEASPLTQEQRQADIAAWKRWRMQANHKALAEFRDDVSHRVAKGLWGYGRDMTVRPGLVKVGETVTVTFKCKNNPVESAATLEFDYLRATPGPSRALPLDWQQDGKGGHVATVNIQADTPGNARIVWKGNGERLTRVFGVVEPGYAVCTLWVGSNVPAIDQEIHKFDLPGEYWVGDWWSPFDKTPESVLKTMNPLIDMHHVHGDVLVPFVNAQWILPGIPNFNVFDLDADVQAEGFTLVRDFMAVLGLSPLDLVASYTMGHATTAAVAQAGIKGLTSLCVWQNWLDGGDENGWKINHWGCPIVPYYIADDDFRKVAPGQSVIGFNMGTATSVRNYSVMCLEGCPSNVIPHRRYSNDGVVPANIHRFYYAVDGWLNDAANNREPLFFTTALENFVGREEWRKANELAVEYLVQQAKDKKLLFATSADVASYYLNHYAAQPEHIFYQPDVYCGLRPDIKPAALQDRIEFSNHLCHSLHVDGQVLPQVMWDFTTRWQNQEWDPSRDYRVANGLIPPETTVEHCCLPKNVELKHAKANVSTKAAGGTMTVSVELDLPSPLRFLTLALWQLPLAAEGLQVRCDSPNAAWRSVADGFSGNLNGLVLLENVAKGRSSVTLTFQGTPAQPRYLEFQVGDSICGRAVTIGRQPCVYLWRADGVKETTLDKAIPGGRDVYALTMTGEQLRPDAQGRLILPFTERWQDECYLVHGVTREDMLA